MDRLLATACKAIDRGISQSRYRSHSIAVTVSRRIDKERPSEDEVVRATILVQDQFDWHPQLTDDTFTPRIPDGFSER